MSEELDERIRQAAEVLKSYGATEVYVFGSAITGDLRRHSDIDMAVLGLSAKVFIKAMGDASDILGRPVDLVDLSKATPFAQYLRDSGTLKHVG